MPKNKCEIIYRKAPGLNDCNCNYPGFKPGQTILKKGTVCKEGHMPLPSDILFERDVAIEVRDGTILYADIYRGRIKIEAGNVPQINLKIRVPKKVLDEASSFIKDFAQADSAVKEKKQ